MQGTQMVPIMKSIGVDMACYGVRTECLLSFLCVHHCAGCGGRLSCVVGQNHDFDFGCEALVKLARAVGCPWLISNAHDKQTGRPLAGGKAVGVLEKNGVRLGFIGLVEKAWLATLAHIDLDQVVYTDFVESARTLSKELREEAGCDIVIVLSHMRLHNDKKLAEEVGSVDLILSGHDHECVAWSVDCALFFFALGPSMPCCVFRSPPPPPLVSRAIGSCGLLSPSDWFTMFLLSTQIRAPHRQRHHDRQEWHRLPQPVAGVLELPPSHWWCRPRCSDC